MNMQCSKCGQILNGNETFCPKCGNNVQQQPQANIGVSSPMNEGVDNTTNLATNAFVNTTSNIQQTQNMSGEVNFNSQQNSQSNYNTANNVQPKKNHLGTISLVIGIVALIVCFKTAIVGLILGIVVIILASQYKKQTNQKTAGKVLGIISVVFSSISLVIGLVFVGGLAFLANSLGTSTSTDTLTCKYNGQSSTITIEYDYNNTELNRYKISGTFPADDYNINGSISTNDNGELDSEGFGSSDSDGLFLMSLSFMVANEELANINGVTIVESEADRLISVEIDYTKMSDTDKTKLEELGFDFNNYGSKEEAKTELVSSGFVCN